MIKNFDWVWVYFCDLIYFNENECPTNRFHKELTEIIWFITLTHNKRKSTIFSLSSDLLILKSLIRFSINFLSRSPPIYREKMGHCFPSKNIRSLWIVYFRRKSDIQQRCAITKFNDRSISNLKNILHACTLVLKNCKNLLKSINASIFRKNYRKNLANFSSIFTTVLF